MQFHNPEVLFALFLLIIPVIVHFFQLRKFRREYFTNVKFLRRLTTQTRKSSRIKKLLVLTTRLLLLACIILAFSRPYFPEENEITGQAEIIVFLDNSYSMQAQGQRGSLLDRSKQELLEQLPEEHNITLITNSEVYPQVSRQEIQEIEYSAMPADLAGVLLRAGSSFSTAEQTEKKLLLLSNFKDGFDISAINSNLNVDTYVIPLTPQKQNNISIDSLFYTRLAPGDGTLTVILSYTGEDPGSVPISLYNGSILLGKTSIEFSGSTGELEFPVTAEKIEKGRLNIEDNALQFDNELYFSLNQTEPIKVTSINAADAGFLKRIYTEPEFEFSSMESNRIDYNILGNSRVVILNELQDIPGALLTSLLKLSSEDVIVVIIMPAQADKGLIELLNNLGFKGSPVIQESEKLLTGISFEHPLFNGVFEDRVRNFEYPKVQKSYRIDQTAGVILRFEDNSPFLMNAGRHYLFSAALNNENSNFTQSPLIVPTFYNIGTSALKIPQLYYQLGQNNIIDVEANIPGDRILEMGNDEQSFIPRQQSFVNRVRITTSDLPEKPGNYSVYNRDEVITSLSYNIDRSQSKMEYSDLSSLENIKVVNDLEEFFTAAGYKKEVDTLWKWFVTFALIFLVIETLLLKYFK